jgi:hypothetical protein
MTALLRVNTLWKYIFSEPARWLSGKATNALKEWSIDKSSGVLDLVEKAMVAVATDGHCCSTPPLIPSPRSPPSSPPSRSGASGSSGAQPRRRTALSTSSTPRRSRRRAARWAQATRRPPSVSLRWPRRWRTRRSRRCATRGARSAACSSARRASSPSARTRQSTQRLPARTSPTAASSQTSAASTSSCACTGAPCPPRSCLHIPAHPVPSPSSPRPCQQNLRAGILLLTPASPPTGPHRPVVMFPPFSLTTVPRPPSQVLDRREHLRHCATDAQPGL